MRFGGCSPTIGRYRKTLLEQVSLDEAVRSEDRAAFTEVSVTAREFFPSRGFEIVKEENNLVCGEIAKRFQMQKQLK